MRRLAEIQAAIRHAVVGGDDSGIASILVGAGGAKAGANKRLKVHRRHYETSLVTALFEKFPATVWLIGSPLFTEAAIRYIRQYPPQRPCIAEYGEEFPAFLAACATSSSTGNRSLPYVGDFAALEWFIGKTAIAVDQPALPVEALSSIAGRELPNAALALQSALYYFHGSWPVDDLITLYLTDSAPEQMAFEPADARIEVRGARGEFQINRLTPGEFAFRKSLADGHPIGNAADAALEFETSFDTGRALAAVFACRLVTAIKAPAQELS